MAIHKLTEKGGERVTTIKKGLIVLAVLAFVGAFVGSAPGASQAYVKIDGDIFPGEYQYHCAVAKAPAFKADLYWSLDGEFIYVGLSTPAQGWVGWGLMPLDPETKVMEGSDIIIGYVAEGNKLSIRDDYADTPTSHKADTELGGKNDVAEAAGKEDANGTRIEFKRPLYTQDKYDVAVPVRTEVFLGYSDADDFTTAHKGKGEGRVHRELNLIVGKPVVPTSEWNCQ